MEYGRWWENILYGCLNRGGLRMQVMSRYRLFWVILLVGVVGCSTPASVTVPDTALQALEADIYAAVLTQNNLLILDENRPLWIQKTTNPYSAPDLALVDSETFTNFVEANRQSYEMPPQLPLEVPYLYLTESEIEAKVVAGTIYEGDLVTFSRVGFNSAQNQALVYFGFSCGELCAGGYMVVLELEANGWMIVNTVEVWLS